MVLSILLGKIKLQRIINGLSFSLAVAVTDEALQLISDRGSQVQDVLLDFCGVITGTLFSLLLFWLFRSTRQKRKHREI